MDSSFVDALSDNASSQEQEMYSAKGELSVCALDSINSPSLEEKRAKRNSLENSNAAGNQTAIFIEGVHNSIGDDDKNSTNSNLTNNKMTRTYSSDNMQVDNKNSLDNIARSASSTDHRVLNESIVLSLIIA